MTHIDYSNTATATTMSNSSSSIISSSPSATPAQLNSLSTPPSYSTPASSQIPSSNLPRSQPQPQAQPPPSYSSSNAVHPPISRAKNIPNRVKKYHARSITGCLTCRKRRVKCDETKPSCQNCGIRNRLCVYPEQVQASSPASSSSSSNVNPATPLTPVPSLTGANEISSRLARTIRPPTSYVTGGIPNPSDYSLVRDSSARPSPGGAPANESHLNDNAAPLDRTRTMPVFPDPLPQFGDLSPYFPTMEQQSLFQHYIQNVASQLCLLPTHPDDNQWIRYHARFAFQTPAGVNDCEDALRSALMSMSALDIGHKFVVMNEGWSSNPLTSPIYPVNGFENSFLQLSHERRKESLTNLQRALDLRAGRLSSPDADLIFAAVLCLITRDRLAAQQDWQESLRIAQRTIQELGGVSKYLDPAEPSRLFLIEQIASLEVMTSLTSDESTVFLKPWDEWWYSLMDTSLSAKDDGVKQTFGLHRGMIDMLARMTRIEDKRRHLELQTHSKILLLEEGASIRPTGLTDEQDEMRLWAEASARALLQEIPMWRSAYNDEEKDCGILVDTGIREDVPALMNQIYACVADLYTNSVIFQKPPNHPSLEYPMLMILDLCERSVKAHGTKGLLAPLIMATFPARGQVRNRIRNLFSSITATHKFDLAAVEKLASHLWFLGDAGLAPKDWQLFLKSVGCFGWTF
ncbi:hypothetical protein IE53DRAFT_387790 [Violaceomyces palustris]|uniref:Uncharacterized protein n=1 Tax=Violaceomyces palustris TaxID=1673888 RepID=A0ACD0NVR8_9BASI|nr:hypothetical protein IE53DRAFT_387790 [Violaceomyces palustris]